MLGCESKAPRITYMDENNKLLWTVAIVAIVGIVAMVLAAGRQPAMMPIANDLVGDANIAGQAAGTCSYEHVDAPMAGLTNCLYWNCGSGYAESGVMCYNTRTKAWISAVQQ